MLHLQAINLIINKENIPPTFDPQNKKLTPHLNQVPSKTRRSNCIERGIHSLKKANMSLNTELSSLADHLNGRTKSLKMGLGSVFTKKKKQCTNDYMDISNANFFLYTYRPILRLVSGPNKVTI
jgi:hypothetical protein